MAQTGVDASGLGVVFLSALVLTEEGFDATFTLRLTCAEAEEPWEHSYHFYTISADTVVLPEVEPWICPNVTVSSGETALIQAPAFVDPEAAEADGWSWLFAHVDHLSYYTESGVQMTEDGQAALVTGGRMGSVGEYAFALRNSRLRNYSYDESTNYPFRVIVPNEDGETPRLTAVSSTDDTLAIEQNIYDSFFFFNIEDIRLDGALVKAPRVTITASSAPEGVTLGVKSASDGEVVLYCIELLGDEPYDFTFVARITEDGEVWEQPYRVYSVPAGEPSVDPVSEEPEYAPYPEEIVVHVGDLFTVDIPTYADAQAAQEAGWRIAGYASGYNSSIQYVRTVYDVVDGANHYDSIVYAALKSGRTRLVFHTYNESNGGDYPGRGIAIPVVVLDEDGSIGSTPSEPVWSTPSEPVPSTPGEPVPAEGEWGVKNYGEAAVNGILQDENGYYSTDTVTLLDLYYGGEGVGDVRVEVVSKPEGVAVHPVFKPSGARPKDGYTHLGTVIFEYRGLEGDILADIFDFPITLRVTADGAEGAWEGSLQVHSGVPGLKVYNYEPIEVRVGDVFFIPRPTFSNPALEQENERIYCVDSGITDPGIAVRHYPEYWFTQIEDAYRACQSGVGYVEFRYKGMCLARVQVIVRDYEGNVDYWSAFTEGEDLRAVEMAEPRAGLKIGNARLTYGGNTPNGLRAWIDLDDGAPAGTALRAETTDWGEVEIWADCLPAGAYDFTYSVTFACDDGEETCARTFRVRTISEDEIELPEIIGSISETEIVTVNQLTGIMMPYFANTFEAEAEGWAIRAEWDTSILLFNYYGYDRMYYTGLRDGETTITFTLYNTRIPGFERILGQTRVTVTRWSAYVNSAECLLKQDYEQYGRMVANANVFSYDQATVQGLAAQIVADGLPDGVSIRAEIVDGGWMYYANVYADLPAGAFDFTFSLQLTCANGDEVWEREFRVYTAREEDIVIPELAAYECEEVIGQVGGEMTIPIPQFADPDAANAEGWNISYFWDIPTYNSYESDNMIWFTPSEAGCYGVRFSVYSTTISGFDRGIVNVEVTVAGDGIVTPSEPPVESGWQMQLGRTEIKILEADWSGRTEIFYIEDILYEGRKPENMQFSLASDELPEGVTLRSDYAGGMASLYVDNLPAGPFDFNFTASLACDGCVEAYEQVFRVRSIAMEEIEVPELLPFEVGEISCTLGEQISLPLPQFADPAKAASEGWYFNSITTFDGSAQYADHIEWTANHTGIFQVYYSLACTSVDGLNLNICNFRVRVYDNAIVTPSEPVESEIIETERWRVVADRTEWGFEATTAGSNRYFRLSEITYDGQTPDDLDVDFLEIISPTEFLLRYEMEGDGVTLCAENLPAGVFDIVFTITMTCAGCEEVFRSSFHIYAYSPEEPIIPEPLNPTIG